MTSKCIQKWAKIDAKSLKSCVQKNTKKVTTKNTKFARKTTPENGAKTMVGHPLGAPLSSRATQKARMAQKGAPKLATQAEMDTKMLLSKLNMAPKM